MQSRRDYPDIFIGSVPTQGEVNMGHVYLGAEIWRLMNSADHTSQLLIMGDGNLHNTNAPKKLTNKVVTNQEDHSM